MLPQSLRIAPPEHAPSVAALSVMEMLAAVMVPSPLPAQIAPAAVDCIEAELPEMVTSPAASMLTEPAALRAPARW